VSACRSTPGHGHHFRTACGLGHAQFAKISDRSRSVLDIDGADPNPSDRGISRRTYPEPSLLGPLRARTRYPHACRISESTSINTSCCPSDRRTLSSNPHLHATTLSVRSSSSSWCATSRRSKTHRQDGFAAAPHHAGDCALVA